MNMQAMLKQAKKMQNDMMKVKEEIDNQIYEGKSSMVIVKLNGKKEVKDVKINLDKVDKEDIEILEDMILVAFNEATKKIDKDTEEKMGKYTKGMPGIF